jgi:threonine synthase
MINGILICTVCRRSFAADEPRWRCDCGGILDLDFAPRFDRPALAGRPATLWRYREALPIRDEASIVSLGEGFTPLIAIELMGRTVHLKLDHLSPTGSFKDRGATVLVSHAREIGIERVVEDSSGNAGAALAAYAAAAGIGCRIFAPEGCSPGKLAQIGAAGAALTEVAGPRGETTRAVLRAAESTWYASHGWSPYFLHGTKTCAYEIVEQLGWSAPDVFVVPVGNGTLLLGAHLGFGELRAAGLIDRIPRLVAVQPAHCAPLHRAFVSGATSAPKVEASPTVAEGTAVDEPIRGMQILAAVRATGGVVLSVGEDEILDALALLLGRGHCVEPTAAVGMAGLRKTLPEMDGDEVAVVVMTGHGLKAGERLAGFRDGPPIGGEGMSDRHGSR